MVFAVRLEAGVWGSLRLSSGAEASTQPKPRTPHRADKRAIIQGASQFPVENHYVRESFGGVEYNSFRLVVNSAIVMIGDRWLQSRCKLRLSVTLFARMAYHTPACPPAGRASSFGSERQGGTTT